MIKILIAGEGGQGIQLIAEILSKAAFNIEKYSLYIPNFGVEQRGGVSLAFIQVDNQPIYYPKFDKADFVVVMCERAKVRVKQYLDEKSLVISYLDFQKGIVPQRVFNVFLLGVLLRKSSVLSLEPVEEVLDEILHKKFIDNPEIKRLNYEALKLGYEYNPRGN